MKISPIAMKAAALQPDLIAATCSVRDVQRTLEDCQEAILHLAYTLQSIQREVAGTEQPYSLDSYLPAHLVEMMNSALGYPVKEAA